MQASFLRAMIIVNSLMGKCGLSHKRVEDGTFVKVTGDMVSLMRLYAKRDLQRKVIYPVMG